MEHRRSSKPRGPRRIFRMRRREPMLRRRPRIPPVAFPSTFTLLNLLSGFFAIIMAAQADYVAAAWLIVAAGLFDLFDGMMARLVQGTSEFGVELDSLADMVSFGVAPSFLLYEFGLHQLGFAGGVAAALPAICASVRLARFNITFQVKKNYFNGLPTPAAAATVVAFILVFADVAWLEGRREITILVTLAVVLSVLMVSTIKFDALELPGRRLLRSQPWKALAMLIAVVLLIFFQEVGLFIVLLTYLGHGIGRALLWAFRTATEDEAPSTDEPPGPDPSPLS